MSSSSPNSIHIIGDVHGQIDKYNKIIGWENMSQHRDHSVQIGDMGFDYSEIMPDNRHKVLLGNHDNYGIACPNSLGDFGYTSLNGVKFFFVRGAFSIDYKQRTSGINWWIDEEVCYYELQNAIDLYTEIKPDFVITHDCPDEISHLINDGGALRQFGFDPATFTSKTQMALQAMFEAHQPKLWVFGHYHKNWTKEVKGTSFRCVNSLDSIKVTSTSITLSSWSNKKNSSTRYEIEYGEKK